MSDSERVEPAKQWPDQEVVARLAYEIKRASLVWNYFAGNVIDGFYPPSKMGERTERFRGTDREQIEQLFKIRDHEVRYLSALLRELGLENVPIDYTTVYEHVSKSTEITKISHRNL